MKSPRLFYTPRTPRARSHDPYVPLGLGNSSKVTTNSYPNDDQSKKLMFHAQKVTCKKQTSRIRTRSLAGISAHSRATHSRQSQVTRLLSQAQRSSGTVTTCVKETLRKALGQQGICSICRAPAGTRGSIIDRLIPTPVGGLSLRG